MVINDTTARYFKETFDEKLLYPHDLHSLNHKEALFWILLPQ